MSKNYFHSMHIACNLLRQKGMSSCKNKINVTNYNLHFKVYITYNGIFNNDVNTYWPYQFHIYSLLSAILLLIFHILNKKPTRNTIPLPRNCIHSMNKCTSTLKIALSSYFIQAEIERNSIKIWTRFQNISFLACAFSIYNNNGSFWGWRNYS